MKPLFQTLRDCNSFRDAVRRASSQLDSFLFGNWLPPWEESLEGECTTGQEEEVRAGRA